MVQPPGRHGLVERLAALDRRITETTRQSQAGPVCLVRLGLDVTTWDVDRKDVVPVTSWHRVAEVDTRGMWHYNEGADSWIELPCAGRFAVTVASRWAPPAAYNSAVPNELSTAVLHNGSFVAQHAIAETTAYHLPSATTAYQVTCNDRVFADGDRVRVNFWSRFAGVRLQAASLAATTYVLVRYLSAT